MLANGLGNFVGLVKAAQLQTPGVQRYRDRKINGGGQVLIVTLECYCHRPCNGCNRGELALVFKQVYQFAGEWVVNHGANALLILYSVA